MDVKPEHPAHRLRDKWPNAPPELGHSTRESTSSTSGGSVLELVRRVSRTCSIRTSSILERVGLRPGKRMSWYAGSVDGDEASCSRDSTLPAWETIPAADIDPLLGTHHLRSSIRFSSYQSRAGTLRSRRVGEVFQSCRNKLSMNSLRESIDHMLDRDGGSAACYFQLSSSDPPRLDVLQDLDPSAPKDDGFRTSLEEAIQVITARGKSADYVNEADLKPSSRKYNTMQVRGKAADSSWATEALKGIMTQSCEELSCTEKPIIDEPDLDTKHPSLENSIGEASRMKLKANACIRKAREPQKGILQFSGNEPSGLSPSTARLVADLGIKVDVSPSQSITGTVKLVYPWFQGTEGRLEVCPSHEAAMNMLQATQSSSPVHDLAFYDPTLRSYILHPKCFLVDREVVDEAQSRGINLVSLSRRWQALKGVNGAEDLRPGELDMGGASVGMACDGDYVVVSIHRSDASEVPVFIEAEDEQMAIEDDGDAVDEELEP